MSQDTKPAPGARWVYLENDWIPLPAPDPRAEPGAIFSYVQATKELHYVTSLRNCGVPEAAASVLEAPGREYTYSKSGMSLLAMTVPSFTG